MGLDMYLYKQTLVKDGADLAALGIQVNRVSRLTVSGPPFDRLNAAFGNREVDEDGTLYVGNEFRSLPSWHDPVIPFDVFPPNVTHIIERVAYWRKANAIHRWFVQTLADGVDECQEIPVPLDALVQLRNIAGRILHARGATRLQLARTLLPTEGGFFFGSTDYDKGYIYDLRATVQMLRPIADEIRTAADFTSLIYRASW